MTVAMWRETTNITIATILAVIALTLASILTWRSIRPAREGSILPAAAIAAAVAAVVMLSPYTPDSSALQDVLNRHLSNQGPFAAQIWADAWSNINTITVCTVLLHYIYIALELLLLTALAIAGFAALRWFADHPAAQHSESLVEGLRRTLLINRPEPDNPVATEPVATPSRSFLDNIKKPAPALVALAAAAAVIVSAVILAGLWPSEPESSVAQHHPKADPPAPYAGPSTPAPTTGSSGGTLQPGSRLAAEPNIVIPFPLTNEPCSFQVTCAIRNANGRFTLDLTQTNSVHSVSLVPDALIPGRIVTKARWDFADPFQTSRTVDYDAIKDRGWAVGHDLGTGVRTSQIALTVLSSVPIDPNAGPPPGPGLAPVLSVAARPLADSTIGSSGRDADPAAVPTGRLPR